MLNLCRIWVVFRHPCRIRVESLSNWGSIQSIEPIRSIVHTGKILSLKLINETKKTHKRWELEHRGFDCKYYYNSDILTAT